MNKLIKVFGIAIASMFVFTSCQEQEEPLADFSVVKGQHAAQTTLLEGIQFKTVRGNSTMSIAEREKELETILQDPTITIEGGNVAQQYLSANTGTSTSTTIIPTAEYRISSTYDQNKKITESFSYDKKQRLIRYYDFDYRGIYINISTYDTKNRITKYTVKAYLDSYLRPLLGSNAGTVTISYDAAGKMSTQRLTVGKYSINNTYTYSATDKISRINSTLYDGTNTDRIEQTLLYYGNNVSFVTERINGGSAITTLKGAIYDTRKNYTPETVKQILLPFTSLDSEVLTKIGKNNPTSYQWLNHDEYVAVNNQYTYDRLYNPTTIITKHTSGGKTITSSKTLNYYTK